MCVTYDSFRYVHFHVKSDAEGWYNLQQSDSVREFIVVF